MSGREFADEAHRVVGAAALADDLEPPDFLQAARDALAQQRMVVHDDDPDGCRSSASPSSSLSRHGQARAVGELSIVECPPRLSTRSRRPARPRPVARRRSGRRSRGPRSATVDASGRRPRRRPRRSGRAPPAWRKALFRPSCTKRKTQIFSDCVSERLASRADRSATLRSRALLVRGRPRRAASWRQRPSPRYAAGSARGRCRGSRAIASSR